MISRLACVFPLVLLFAACTPALPVVEPEAEMKNSLVETDDSVSLAYAYAAEARLQAARAEELLRQAQKLYREAKEAEAHCEELVNTIPKKKKRVYRKKKSTKKSKAPKEDTPPKPTYPQYSPSDAPVDSYIGGSKSKAAAPVNKKHSASDAPHSGKAVDKAPSGAGQGGS